MCPAGGTDATGQRTKEFLTGAADLKLLVLKKSLNKHGDAERRGTVTYVKREISQGRLSTYRGAEGTSSTQVTGCRRGPIPALCRAAAGGRSRGRLWAWGTRSPSSEFLGAFDS